MAVAAVPAGMFVLVGSTVRTAADVPYRCPSAAQQLVEGRGVRIAPTVLPDEVRLYDPRDPSLVDAPGVWEACRDKNLQAGGIAVLVLAAGAAWPAVRGLRRRQPDGAAPGQSAPSAMRTR